MTTRRRPPTRPAKPSPAPDAPAQGVTPPDAGARRSVTFPATIPPMETAIKIHGEGGARLILDIAESDLGAFVPALALRQRRLTVTLTERAD